jgi:hypothetical protein
MQHGLMKVERPLSILLVFKLRFETFCLTAMVLSYATIMLSMQLLSVAILLIRATLIYDSFHRYSLQMFEYMASIPMILLCSSVRKRLSIIAVSTI